MRTVFLVPWRSDGAAREKAWSVCKARWQALFPDWPIYEGSSPEGPFNRAAAINDAAAQAGDWDVAVIIDADVMLWRSNVLAAVERARETGKVTWAHRRWRGINQESTERLCRPDPIWAEGALGEGGIAAPEFGADLDLIIEKTTRMSWSCCMAVRRDSWETIGGFDERFAGWGFEDLSFQAASGGLVGWDRIEGDVLNLWHPRVPGAGKADRDASNRYTPQALVNGRLGMRYMVALRRDHGLTDRPEPASEIELARDIRNLEKQDERFAQDQTEAERKPFDGWWPTLEELRDGAIEYRKRRETGITVIVHTGGNPDNWPERREYLVRSLASLMENVSGPIIQRVIYDCWGSESIRAELEAIGAPHGFYVAGPTERPDYTGSMRLMWRYLSRKALGTYIFQAEDDFLYERRVDLAPLVATLRDNPHLTQVALLRGAAYESERKKGGILGWPVESFSQKGSNGTRWLEHRNFWTANPSLFRKTLTLRPWPQGTSSERLFADGLFRDAKAAAAFWGKGEPWIQHIGEVRAGAGY